MGKIGAFKNDVTANFYYTGANEGFVKKIRHEYFAPAYFVGFTTLTGSFVIGLLFGIGYVLQQM